MRSALLKAGEELGEPGVLVVDNCLLLLSLLLLFFKQKRGSIFVFHLAVVSS